MPTPLVDLIARIRTNLEARAYPNERSVVSRVVMQILESAGWDLHNPRQVIEEFSPIPTQIGKKVDLALCALPSARKADAYLEAKAHGMLARPEAIAEAEAQLAEYESYYRVTLAVLTDGEVWQFYFPLADGTYADRLALSINLLRDPQELVASHLTNLLSFKQIADAKVSPLIRELHRLRHAQQQYRADFPNVWRKLLGEPTDALIEVVIRAYQNDFGTAPEPELVRELIKSSNVHEWNQADDSFEADKEGDENSLDNSDSERSTRSRIRITLSWVSMNKNRATQIISEHMASNSLRVFMETLVEALGASTLDRIATYRVSRGPLISKTPKVHYRYRDTRFYQYQAIANTGYYVLTHSRTSQKVSDLHGLVRHMGWPAGFLRADEVVSGG